MFFFIFEPLYWWQFFDVSDIQLFKKQMDLVYTSGDKTFFDTPPLPSINSNTSQKVHIRYKQKKLYIYVYSLCYCMLALRLQKFHSMIVAIFW